MHRNNLDRGASASVPVGGTTAEAWYWGRSPKMPCREGGQGQGGNAESPDVSSNNTGSEWWKFRGKKGWEALLLGFFVR